MDEVSALKINENTYEIKDAEARQSASDANELATTASEDATTALGNASTALTNANTAIARLNNSQLVDTYTSSSETLTLSLSTEAA